ncbi:hypothetical protein [Roseinatronobacter sp.]|nr:hypothetical protein [Roseibaca sp.]
MFDAMSFTDPAGRSSIWAAIAAIGPSRAGCVLKTLHPDQM